MGERMKEESGEDGKEKVAREWEEKSGATKREGGSECERSANAAARGLLALPASLHSAPIPPSLPPPLLI